MTLRWTPFIGTKPPKSRFPLTLDLAWRKSATKFLCVKTVSDQVVLAFIGLSIRAKMIGGDVAFYIIRKHLADNDQPPCKTPIFNLFSLVAPQPQHLAKMSVNTNRKSSARFSMILRQKSYVASKPPKGAQNRKIAVFHVKSHFTFKKVCYKVSKWGDYGKSKWVIRTLIRSLV